MKFLRKLWKNDFIRIYIKGLFVIGIILEPFLFAKLIGIFRPDLATVYFESVIIQIMVLTLLICPFFF